MILLIDNYDSFTYNIYQLIGEIEPDIKIVRNDELTFKEIENLQPQGIIISSGPGRPEDSGVCPDIITNLGPFIPILGICLGHQAICQTFGGTVTYSDELMHGKKSEVEIDIKSPIYRNCPKIIEAARYDSLVLQKGTLDKDLKITGSTENGVIMSVEHIEHPIYGLQYHPESIMTSHGKTIFKNFIDITKLEEK